MTTAERNHLEELLERIVHRHCSQRIGEERLLREAATHQDAREALHLIRQDEAPA